MGSKTANYQLNQWEAGDSFLRTDFNEDNAKIDAALANNNRRVLLREITLTANASSINVDMTGLLSDSEYWQIEVCLEGTGSASASAYVTLNGKNSSGHYKYLSSNGSYYDTSCFGNLPLSQGTAKAKGRLVLYTNVSQPVGYIDNISTTPTRTYYYMTANSGESCESLTTLTVTASSGSILAGSCLKVYGVKL